MGKRRVRHFKNILVCGEMSRLVLKRAVALATRSRARLTLLDALPEIPAGTRHLRIGNRRADLQTLLVDERRRQLQKAAKGLDARSVKIAVDVVCGIPFVEIIRDVLQHERDLVMTTAEDTPGFGDRIFRTTAMRLVRQCPCPVWIVKPARRTGPRRILAAVDPDTDDQRRQELNHRIMELATSLATIEHAGVHVVYAWNLPGESVLLGPGGLYAADLRRILKEQEARHRRVLEGFLDRYGTDVHEVHLVKGPASDVIADTAGRLGVDLVVMGTVCRTGVPGLFIGNTAERVLPALNCSALTVKPAGFVSPVTLRSR